MLGLSVPVSAQQPPAAPAAPQQPQVLVYQTPSVDARETQNQLLASRFQLASASFDLLFKSSCFAGCHVVMLLDHNRISNAWQQFIWINRFLQKVARTQIQSLFTCRRVGGRSQNQHRNMLKNRVEPRHSHDVQTADFRHTNIKQQDVRAFRSQQVKRFPRVTGGHKFFIAFHLQVLTKRHHVQWLVIHNHDFCGFVDGSH